MFDLILAIIDKQVYVLISNNIIYVIFGWKDTKKSKWMKDKKSRNKKWSRINCIILKRMQIRQWKMRWDVNMRMMGEYIKDFPLKRIKIQLIWDKLKNSLSKIDLMWRELNHRTR